MSKESTVSTVSVEDRVLIRDLYDRFYMAFNEGDQDEVRRGFAPEGRVARYMGEPVDAEGPAANGAKWSKDPIGRTYQHHVTSVVVEPDEDGRDDYRKVRMYFLVTGVWEPPHVIVRWSCKSTDLVRKVDGEWRFSDRRITLNHDSTGPHWDGEPTHVK
jgi:hypothetical protein